VRFAPSPTGRLHVGGARTALFNWLFARHHNGVMVLRIEDTDTERSTRASEDSLLRDLRWLGLDWDEGPDVGGPHGPYRQSERCQKYAAAAAQLVRDGLAYPSADSEADVAASESRDHKTPRERTPVAAFDATALAQQIIAGTSPAIRFRLPEGMIHYEDAVRGPLQIDTDTLSDFILLRSSGLPTYNFACVVDDADMQITHVLRGEDHLYNTSRQVLLYDALQLARPQFVHLSLILGEDRTKLKKRDGREGTFVDEYRTRGFLPDALVNFLALLGWSPQP
jgi:glutamyl-tRNA synthetase